MSATYTMTDGFTTGNGGSPGVSMTFFDLDMDEDEIQGTLTITKATDETLVDEYRLYWGSSATAKLAGQGVIQSYTAYGTDKTEAMSANTAVPGGANYMLVYTVSGGTEFSSPTALDIPDGIVKFVKEIKSGGDAALKRFRSLDDLLYFAALDDSGFVNLWRSDGTAAGTYRVNETNQTAGTNSGAIRIGSVGSTLFFSAAHGSSTNYELWKSDGTDAGTDLLHEIEAGTAGSQIQLMTTMGTDLFFRANDGSSNKLFKTDGTTLTTVTPYAPASEFRVIGSTLYFNATDDGTEGIELWKSNGSAGNAELVKNINTVGDPVHSNIGSMKEFNDTLYFSTTNGTANGAELWKSDGSTAGTVLVKDIFAGTDGSDLKILREFNSELYIAARSGLNLKELWKTDGTSGGTTLVKTTSTDGAAIYPSEMTVGSDTFFFTAADSATNKELWKSDGTGAGTSMIDINTGGQSDPSRLTLFGDRLFVLAIGDSAGRELWVTDGTVTGSFRLTDINSSGDSFDINYEMRPSGTNPFFAATDGGTLGEELWRYYVK